MSVGFEVPTSVVMKSLLDITSYKPLKFNRHFGGTNLLIFRVKEEARQETSMKQETRKQHIPPKCRLTFSGQHSVILQEI
jgi:hypothetical protein